MALLAATLYDPTTVVNKGMTTLTAMTKFDTTNLRLTFTAPTSGTVMVRLAGTLAAGTTGALNSGNQPAFLVGVMSGTTVVGRALARVYLPGAWATGATMAWEATFAVTGLSGSQTWDAAFANQVTANTQIRYGGPNDTAGGDAYGGLAFEIYG